MLPVRCADQCVVLGALLILCFRIGPLWGNNYQFLVIDGLQDAVYGVR